MTRWTRLNLWRSPNIADSEYRRTWSDN